jgi:DNA-binding winged helix-turn-helix (wHTH) protein/tetratricopeptide (TPR) repeat protein
LDPTRNFHFDEWTLVRPVGELVRGSTRVRLQSQPLLVLEALLSQPGEMVTREQLIARLWPNGVVVDFDTALNSAVRRLRTALDDHAESPRYIETIPRRGYRFIGHVHPRAPEHVTGETMPAGATGPEPAPRPFVNDIPPARPRAPTRTRLAVMTVAVLTLVAATMALWPGRQPPVPADAALATNSVQIPADALERYERARFFLNRREPGDTAQSLALFEQALRIEPRYARAWAGIASVRWIDTMEGCLVRQHGLELTRAAAERALALDPGIAEAYLRLANCASIAGDRAQAQALARRAEMLEPNDPLVLVFKASSAAGSGRFDEAIALQRRAVQAGPLSVAMRRNLVVWLFMAGRFEEARLELVESHAISNKSDALDGLTGQAMLLTGDYQAALDLGLGMPEGSARDQILALAYHALGRKTESDAALQKLAASVPGAMAYMVAEVHAYRGENDAAFEWLQRFTAADPADCRRNECWPAEWVPSLPLLQPLRHDPRWAVLMTPPPAVKGTAAAASHRRGQSRPVQLA